MDQSAPWISLKSDGLTAQINPLGAQLSVLRDRADRDVLWNGDPSVWVGRAPLLFPIVGALNGGNYHLGSQTHALPRHGFARVKLFDVIDTTTATASLRLRADESTLPVYPYRFELDVHYALDGATLTVTANIRNTGDADMPASFGYHPAFRWPLPYGRSRSSHFIEFASVEPAPFRRLNKDGLMTPYRHPTVIVNRRLTLNDALFRDDVVIFDQVRSRSVIYGADDGPRIQVSYPDMPFLGIWTKPQANFICIEPWHGIADPADFSGDFTEKPGVFCVVSGATATMKMAITILGA